MPNGPGNPEARPRIGIWPGLCVALAGLNFCLSFHNVWPTPWVTARFELSVEIAALVLLLALYTAWRGAPSPRALTVLAVLLTLACIGRYAEVTAPALYGRPVNLYWDAQHLPRVAAMLADATSGWLLALVIVAACALLAALFLALRRMLRCTARALSLPAPRRVLTGISGTLIALFLAGHLSPRVPSLRWFSLPVTLTYAQQLGFLRQALAGDEALDVDGPGLPQSDLQRIAGADVIVAFIESYGATTFDRPGYARALEASRTELASAVRSSGRGAVSAFVTSPTFGGASWLAHSSFLSGVEVTDNRLYQLLLTRSRETLIHRFAQHGYRTLGLMPGLRQAWPEGAFYGYDALYDAAALDYRGPAFGWWRIPDQFALARLNAVELAPRTRAPVLLVFTTISTHAPFRPVPPYREDWQALLGPAPFAGSELAAKLAATPDWTDLGPSYEESVNYALRVVAGFLARRAGRDMVLIVIGDHQPPASVSGPGQPWDVPVHIISSRPALLEALGEEGFGDGLTPARPSLGPMHELAPKLLRAFGEYGRQAAVSSVPVQRH